MTDRLLRSREDRMVGGVCAGLGSYLRIDPMLVRVFFVLLTLAEGAGLILYLILWLIIPGEAALSPSDVQRNMREGAAEISTRAREIGGEIRGNQGLLRSQAGAASPTRLCLLAKGPRRSSRNAMRLWRATSSFWMSPASLPMSRPNLGRPGSSTAKWCRAGPMRAASSGKRNSNSRR